MRLGFADSEIDFGSVDAADFGSYDFGSYDFGAVDGFDGFGDIADPVFTDPYPIDPSYSPALPTDGMNLGDGFTGADDFGGQFVGDSIADPLAGESFDDYLSSLTTGATSPTGGFGITDFITKLAQVYANYDLQRRQLQQQGRNYTPPRPTPGQVIRLPDGSTARTNADGSTTITTPTGQQRTVTPSGRVVQGGGGLFANVDQKTLLIGGAAAVGLIALLALRRR